MNIQSIGVSLILILSLAKCRVAQAGSASGSHSPPASPQNVEIDWKGLDNLVDIEKDPEWNAYHHQTSGKRKVPEQHQQVIPTKAVEDDGFWSNAKTKRGLQEARRLWLLKKNDPEKYNRLRKGISARYRQRQKEKKPFLSKEVAQKRFEQRKKSMEKYRLKFKQKTGFTRAESVELKRIREQEKIGKATPEELAKLEKVRSKQRPIQRKYLKRKKLENLAAHKSDSTSE